MIEFQRMETKGNGIAPHGAPSNLSKAKFIWALQGDLSSPRSDRMLPCFGKCLLPYTARGVRERRRYGNACRRLFGIGKGGSATCPCLIRE